jgi:putative isomerase
MKRVEEVSRPLKELMLKRGVLKDPETGLQYYAGYNYNTLYDWDLYLETITLYYLGLTEYSKNSVRLFLSQQREDGFIARVFQRGEPLGWRSEENLEHCKPFLAQAALFMSQYDGDYEWLRGELFHKLRKYVNYWLDACDRDGNGLSEWNSAPHSGEDNQFERAGGWQANYCEGVDLNAFICRECRALAQIAEHAADRQQALDLREAADARAAAVRELLWDSGDAIFYDRHRRTGRLIKVKYALSFATLWAGVATAEQADAAVRRHLLSRDAFWTPYPVSTYARTEPTYAQTARKGDYSQCNWRGSLWMPANYFITHGLRAYGFVQEARELARRSFEVLVMHPAPREWYNAETGEGCGQDPFWGWSGVAAFMPLEIENDCDPTALDVPNLRQKVQTIRDKAGVL